MSTIQNNSNYVDTYDEGYENYQTKSLINNPYLPGTEEYFGWTEGWKAARDDSKFPPKG